MNSAVYQKLRDKTSLFQNHETIARMKTLGFHNLLSHTVVSLYKCTTVFSVNQALEYNCRDFTIVYKGSAVFDVTVQAFTVFNVYTSM